MKNFYRKKPVIIEALKWTGNNHNEIQEFIDTDCYEFTSDKDLIIYTLEGKHRASIGDYIIKGVRNEFYPCKSDIFLQTYEKVR